MINKEFLLTLTQLFPMLKLCFQCLRTPDKGKRLTWKTKFDNLTIKTQFLTKNILSEFEYS